MMLWSKILKVEFKGKIPNITNLATTHALNAVGNKLPDVTDLVKKTNYDGKIWEIGKNILLLLIIRNS